MLDELTDLGALELASFGASAETPPAAGLRNARKEPFGIGDVRSESRDRGKRLDKSLRVQKDSGS